ncbi:MAG: bifunctional heptose 7-phosphate kinase/heptose 1-phosphate adenyltransferase [Gammaproteobacteria bacterium]|jgi:D-beta-D-heptose 7-phosphate kinase/D-beta-D-heptose 1-phosphate adenosyltransferase|nr:bifunctional heptose 7-phosphate kinase/heptose 1-phosphate adenyltransferase [Gammaproteobacteria bacterium]
MTYFIPDFSKARVLVVGDVMLDRYWSGPIHRISPEAPVPVVNIKSDDECPGGAANVALNVAATDAKAYLLGICGEDAAASALEKKLAQQQVEAHLIKDPQLQTIVKLRILGLRQQLLRLDFEGGKVNNHIQVLKEKFESLVQRVDVVILSDYAKGTLEHAVDLIQIAQRYQVPVFVDPKTNNLAHYQGAFLITPNLKEFQEIVGPCPTEAILLEKGEKLLKETGLPALLVTRSEHGVTLFQQDKPPMTLAAHQQEVYDVTGAGDTVIAYLAASVAGHASLDEAVRLANLAAGISVRKLNAATVSVPELRREIWQLKQSYNEKHILTQQELLVAVDDAKAHGETIVMTNGCFDILHPGHVAYLEQAKQLGDRLIVAVNDDDSVRRLNKGPNRPLNDLRARMQVLAGLRAVDWVTSFSEDTPENLIEKIIPHVLVKGGDYKVEEIAGHKAVIANGGQVIILDFVPGFSTTGLVNKIKT